MALFHAYFVHATTSFCDAGKIIMVRAQMTVTSRAPELYMQLPRENPPPIHRSPAEQAYAGQ